MKLEIKNRFTGAAQVTAEIECDESASYSVKLGLGVRWAIQSEANLSEANLSWANLSKANLSKADLSKANLSKADLSKADLSWANLTAIRDDIFAVLSAAPAEVDGLRTAIAEGRIDGSTYSGTCACLVGTLANVRHCAVDEIPGLCTDSYRAAERFFTAIKPGDTPATNPASALALQWVDDWLARMKAAFAVSAG